MNILKSTFIWYVALRIINTFINIGKYSNGISNGSNICKLRQKVFLYTMNKKNSQKNLFILKGTNERNF
jgi:hypothetical protein